MPPPTIAIRKQDPPPAYLVAMNTMTMNYSPDAYSRKRLLQIYPQPGFLLRVLLHPD
jgi:hypothetical protein